MTRLSRNLLIVALGSVLIFSARALAGLTIQAPGHGGVVLGRTVSLEITGCPQLLWSPEFQTSIDGSSAALSWTKRIPYRNVWQTQIAFSKAGSHQVAVSGRCFFFVRTSDSVSFEVADAITLNAAEKLAVHAMASNPVTDLSWDWGESVFLYGLYKLHQATGRTSSAYLEYVKDFHHEWERKTAPAPDRSDLCPPALTGLAIARDDSDLSALSNVQAVIDYIWNEPRNRVGALNHLGHSFFSNFWPDSIWVDSLMMYAVLGAQWGAYAGDTELLRFSAAQPVLFAQYLQDSDTGLFRHSYNVNTEQLVPPSRTFWLRGNGWVLVSIVEILDALPAHSAIKKDLLSVFWKLAEGIAPYQLSNGMWDSVLNLPGLTYSESSGTALIAYAFAKAVHRGWLSPDYLPIAKRAFAGVTAKLQATPNGFSLPGSSGPTNPGTRSAYAGIGQKTDALYGIGAYLMAASELNGETF